MTEKVSLDQIRKDYAQYRPEKRGFEPGGYIAEILWLVDELQRKNDYIELMAQEFGRQIVELKGKVKHE